MTINVNPFAGKQASPTLLVDIPKLITAYYSEKPDITILRQRIQFGTSGHRGSSFDNTFNENHILAIGQAICLYRKQNNINGPLFLGADTHALSTPAFVSALEVLAANGVNVKISKNNEYTPTPVISHAILKYNKGRNSGFSDGIVITPSHNPPNQGGFKYNPPNGGPADQNITQWIESKANELLKDNLKEVHRISYERALQADTTEYHDYLNEYIDDLENILEMQAIRESNLHIGVDPLGGAGIHYWSAIADRYGLNITVVNHEVDPTFRFMPLDWDGQIRMDPSSIYAMKNLIRLKDKFDIAVACDTDYDRHGIVTKSVGLLPSNHYLAIAIFYLFQNRPKWSNNSAVGKTVVSSEMINRVSEKLKKKVFEVPVGFKWFVEGLINASLAFVGEESAGASFSRKDGSVWTTDKDGFIAALLSAEIMSKTQRDLNDIYTDLTREFGEMFFDRRDSNASPEQKKRLLQLSPEEIKITSLAGVKIQEILTKAPGNNAPIGGVKVITKAGWFAMRPSGTEDIYRVYAESFKSQSHLDQIFEEAESLATNIVNV